MRPAAGPPAAPPTGRLRVGILAGKPAIVTGGGSGIGAAIVEAFADEGARVGATDVDSGALESVRRRHADAETPVTTAIVDVTDPDGTRSMVEECVSEFGSVDVLVNSAGILDEVALVDMDVTAWDRMIDVDLRSVFLCCRWAAPHMAERGAGRIINISAAPVRNRREGRADRRAACERPWRQSLRRTGARPEQRRRHAVDARAPLAVYSGVCAACDRFSPAFVAVPRWSRLTRGSRGRAARLSRARAQASRR